MRSRKWVIILAVSIALTALAINHGWNLLQVDERLKQAFLAELRPVFKGHVDIEKLHLDLGAVHLNGVNIRWENHLYSLRVDDIRVGYNIINLMKYGLHGRRIISGVILTGPKFTLRRLQGYEGLPITDDKEVAEIVDYQKGLASLDYIRRLVVSKGTVVIQDSSGQEIILARDINGWIDSQNLTQATARMAGKLFSSRDYNLAMQGTLNIVEGRLDSLQVELSAFKVTDGIPLFIPSYFKLTSGTLDGEFLVTEKGIAANRRLDISGQVRLSNGGLELMGANLVFKDIQYSAKIENWDLIIEDAYQEFNGSKVQISGRINNILNPQFDLKLISNEFDIGKFIKCLHPKFPLGLSGLSFLQLTLEDSYENPQVHALIYAPRVNFNGVTFRNFKGRLSLKDSLLNVEELRAFASKSQIQATGSIDFSSPQRRLDWKLVSNGDIHPEVEKFVSTDLKSCQWSLETRVFGELKHPQSRGQVTISAFPDKGESFKFRGNYSFQDDTLKIKADCEGEPFSLDGKIVFVDDDPKVEFTVTSLSGALWNAVNIPVIKGLTKNCLFDVTGKGKFSDLNFEVEGFRSRKSLRQTSLFSLRGRLKELKKGTTGVAAEIDYFTAGDRIQGQLNCLRTEDFIEIKSLRLGDFINARSKIGLKGGKSIAVEIIVDEAELNQLVHLSLGDRDFEGWGKISGKISVHGTWDQPLGYARFILREGVLKGVRGYDGEAFFTLTNDNISFASLSIRRKGNTILHTQGWSDLKDGGFDFFVHGSEVNSQSLLQALSGREGILDGLASFGIEIQGTLSRPVIDGQIAVEKGKLFGLDFDSMKISLAEENGSEGSSNFEGGRIRITQLDLRKGNQYSLKAYGTIPFSPKREMDLHLAAEGDLFSLLPRVSGFFQQAHGNGRLVCELTGSPESPIVKSGNLELSNGYLKLSSVIKEAENLNARIGIPSGSRFVEISNVSGDIKGRRFRVYNIDSVPECERKLPPLTIPGLDLNLGICVLETAPKGIPLNIPGLMAKGEVGWIELAGRTEQEKFYIAGPIENPVVRGTIRAKGVNFTYPFIKDAGSENFSASFLEKVDWDLSIQSLRDNHYVRQIPSLVDNVYINLLVDDLVSELELAGVIQDGTLKVRGKLASTRGSLEYLDLSFWVEEFGAEFDGVESRPIVYGRAKTTVTDSLGFPSDIYLTLYTVDKTTGEEQIRGRWGDIRFKLSSNNPNIGNTQGEILAALGYSSESLREKATNLIGISTDNLVFRPLLRPFERRLERSLGLDVVRFTSHFARNLMEMNSSPQTDSRWLLFRSTRVTVGKYLANNLFFLYSGQLEAGLDPRYQEKGMGVKHSLGIEYRINPSLLLEFEYDYNSLLISQREDKRIQLRHTFPF